MSRVPGVPASVSTGGGAGLPERTREGRGLGVESFFGFRAMTGIWGIRMRGSTDRVLLTLELLLPVPAEKLRVWLVSIVPRHKKIAGGIEHPFGLLRQVLLGG